MKASQRYRLHRLAAELVTPARFATALRTPTTFVDYRWSAVGWY